MILPIGKEDRRRQVMQAVVSDTRWDSQLEERAVYLDWAAELAGAEQELVELDPKDCASVELLLEILVVGSLRGRAAMRERLLFLQGDGYRDDIVDAVARYPLSDVAELAVLSPCQNDAVGEVAQSTLSGLSSVEILSRVSSVNFIESVDELRGRNLVRLPRAPGLARAAAFVAASGKHANWVEEAVLTIQAHDSVRERNAAISYLRQVPSSSGRILTLAKKWLHSECQDSGENFRVAGQMLLESLARDEDAPLLASCLNQEISRGNEYACVGLVLALGRLTTLESDVVETLAQFHDRARYSVGRAAVARALTRHSPSLALELSDVWTWDCEADTRVLGVERQLPNSPLLARAIWDPAESQAVKNAARRAHRRDSES